MTSPRSTPAPVVLSGSLWSNLRLAYGLLPVVGVLEQQGLPTERWLRRAGIDAFGMMNPAYTISIQQELDLLRAARSGLPAGEGSLQLARAYRLRGFSVLGLAMQSCATPLQLLGTLLQFPRLAWGVFDCRATMDEHVFKADLQAPAMLGEMEGFLAERDLGCALVVMEEALGAPFRAEQIWFRHRCPGRLADFEDFFGCTVRFSAPSNRIIASVEAMQQPLPYANSTMWAFYTAQCARMSEDMNSPFRLQDLVLEQLHRSRPVADLPELAARLALTPRTLQRRLASEGVRFSDLLQKVRLDRAQLLLRDSDRDLQSIATELGFGEAVAFSHAYKSWTGLAPQKARIALRLKAEPADAPG